MRLKWTLLAVALFVVGSWVSGCGGAGADAAPGKPVGIWGTSEWGEFSWGSE